MSGSKFWAKTFNCLMAKDGEFEALNLANLKKLQITHWIDDGLQHENPL